MNILLRTLLTTFAASAATPCLGAIQCIANPGIPSELGSQISWGARDVEASIFRVSPFTQTSVLDPIGCPGWQVSLGYDFEMQFHNAAGLLSLRVDFNRDGDFLDVDESASQTFTDYVGVGFSSLSIRGNERANPARSTLTNLVINGQAMGGVIPKGALSEVFFEDSAGLLTSLTLSGTLTFYSAGTIHDRPSWSFQLQGPLSIAPPPPIAPAAAPEAATWAIWSVLAAAGVTICRRLG